MSKQNVFLQARVSPEEKKSVMRYVVDHDTSIQALIKDVVMTIVDLRSATEGSTFRDPAGKRKARGKLTPG